MDHDTARKLTEILTSCAKTLGKSSDEVKAISAESAWAPYRIVVAETMGVLYLDLLAELWRDHPDLEPKGGDNVSYYNPEKLRLSREAAEIVIRATTDAKRCIDEAKRLLPPESGPAQEVLDGVTRRLNVAARRCKTQYPDLE